MNKYLSFEMPSHDCMNILSVFNYSDLKPHQCIFRGRPSFMNIITPHLQTSLPYLPK